MLQFTPNCFLVFRRSLKNFTMCRPTEKVSEGLFHYKLLEHLVAAHNSNEVNIVFNYIYCAVQPGKRHLFLPYYIASAVARRANAIKAHKYDNNLQFNAFRYDSYFSYII
jgi:hypothetical protein